MQARFTLQSSAGGEVDSLPKNKESLMLLKCLEECSLLDVRERSEGLSQSTVKLREGSLNSTPILVSRVA